MKRFLIFIDFNMGNVIKNNLRAASIYFLILAIFILAHISNEVAFSDNVKSGVLLLIVILAFLSCFSSVIMPLLVKMYRKYIYNLTSLIGLWIGTLIFGVKLIDDRGYGDFISFMMFSIFASIVALTIKYFVVRIRCRRGFGRIVCSKINK